MGRASSKPQVNKSAMAVASAADKMSIAARWIADADSVIICAGAGMSANPGFNVYVSKEDFKSYYPWFPRWGYATAYECMGLFGDRQVPDTAKWSFWASHMDNMGWKFAPPEQYAELLEMVRDKDYFVYTSNVDGCFARSGFTEDRIYTPQGDWTHYQCMGHEFSGQPCRSDSVFESRPMLDQVVSQISAEDGLLPEDAVPKCPRCGGDVFGNVRGGDWYIHKKYDEANARFVEWVEAIALSKRKLVVIEVGTGFNTPTVTRFPMESIVRELSGCGASLVRVNPDHPGVPKDLPKAVGLAGGCELLAQLARAAKDTSQMVPDGDMNSPPSSQVGATRFPWRDMMESLRR